MQSSNDLISLFNKVFSNYNTVLMGGVDEPLYTPAINNSPAQVLFRADYTRSALHEIAHWVIAGEQRRQKVDYGYWYEADGRNTQRQQDFERVEILPQAIEQLFCTALSIPFRVSVDNLNASQCIDDSEFAKKVTSKAEELQRNGLPKRAHMFLQALYSDTNTTD